MLSTLCKTLQSESLALLSHVSSCEWQRLGGCTCRCEKLQSSGDDEMKVGVLKKSNYIKSIHNRLYPNHFNELVLYLNSLFCILNLI